MHRWYRSSLSTIFLHCKYLNCFVLAEPLEHDQIQLVGFLSGVNARCVLYLHDHNYEQGAPLMYCIWKMLILTNTHYGYANSVKRIRVQMTIVRSSDPANLLIEWSEFKLFQMNGRWKDKNGHHIKETEIDVMPHLMNFPRAILTHLLNKRTQKRIWLRSRHSLRFKYI